MTARLAEVAAALEAGRSAGLAPALAAVVLRGGAPVHRSWHGTVPDPGPRPLAPGDLFDVASLTKPLITATLVAQVVEQGVVGLDAPAARWLPALACGGKERITVRHLLAHASGWPAWRPWWERAAADPQARPAFLRREERPAGPALRAALDRSRALTAAAVLAEPVEAAPGARALYSDAGFVALGLLLEAVLGHRLPALAAARVLGPLGLGAARLADPLASRQAGPQAGAAVVPAGPSRARGGTPVQGEVDDDNAWALGGSAGHAGLFATADDVAALGQAWLDAVLGRGGAVVPPAVAGAFAARDATTGSERALGWDTPSASGSTLGTRLGRGRRGAIGHLGFTGCSLWIDLDAELVVALLTNHVHPAGPDRARLATFRRAVHDAVAAGLGIG